METLIQRAAFGALQDECPALPQAQATLADARELVKALRRLRKRAQRCTRCLASIPTAQQGECLWMQDLNARLDLAIEEILAEWGLA
jgi:hypothetical protein